MHTDNDFKYARRAGSYGALTEMFCDEVDRLLAAEDHVERALASENLRMLNVQARSVIKYEKEVDIA